MFSSSIPWYEIVVLAGLPAFGLCGISYLFYAWAHRRRASSPSGSTAARMRAAWSGGPRREGKGAAPPAVVLPDEGGSSHYG